jgi:hypothetical protein
VGYEIQPKSKGRRVEKFKSQDASLISYIWFSERRKIMSVPSKIHNIQLVKIQPKERLAATLERNLASCLVTKVDS